MAITVAGAEPDNAAKKAHASTRANAIPPLTPPTILIAAVNMVNQQIVTGQTSAALHLPMAVPYAALVISFAMIVIVQGLLMIGMIIDFVKGKNEEEEA